MLRLNLLRCAPRPVLKFGALHGFELDAVRPIPELHLVAYALHHTKTNAKYYHVDTADQNNVFCIGFRTPAVNDKGTSHVLEHTTLCGSKQFPVRDPFFKMLNRSLSNFMNAMTGSDYTLYPFATTNRKDFQNLLRVYLDAVFSPLLREEDFAQEGHRVEGTVQQRSDGGEEVVLGHNGVVFNEMRGVVSDPSTHFMRTVLREMLPGTHYVYNSGGEPIDVLSLTYDELTAFHKKHYTPSNAIAMTYGCEHPEAHLMALEEFFSRFQRSEAVKVPSLDAKNRFRAPREVRLEGPLDVMGNPSLQKRVLVSYAVADKDASDLSQMVKHSVLDELLSSGPSSPMYLALIESQLGAKYAPLSGFSHDLSTPLLSFGVAGVSDACENAEEKVKGAVEAALTKTVKEGFDPRRLQSVVFQMELQQRHRSENFGVSLCTNLCALGLVREGIDPLDFINWLPHLKRVQAEGGSALLPVIESSLLNNPHQGVISVSPAANFVERMRTDINKLNDELNKSASTEEKKSVHRETDAWLERVRAVENCEELPTLTAKDIPAQCFQEPAVLPAAAAPGVESFARVSTIPCPTNGLVYVHGVIPHTAELLAAIGGGAVDQVSSAYPLLVSLLGRTGAGKFSFRELSVESELLCSGFSFGSMLQESVAVKGRAMTGIRFDFYTTEEKLAASLDLLRLILQSPRTSVTDQDVTNRVGSFVKAACSRSIQGLQRSGNAKATSAAAARLSSLAAISDKWFGLHSSKQASVLLDRLQDDVNGPRETEELVSSLGGLTGDVRSAMSNSVLWAACEERQRAGVEAALQSFQQAFASSPSSHSSISVTMANTPSASATERIQHVELPIDTSYVGFAGLTPLHRSHPDFAALRVGCQLLSNEYLHRRVREEGGAYGAGASASLSGEVGGFCMSSYRDPTPEKTIPVFEEAADWLSDVKHLSQRRVDEAKLRLFSGLDAPYTASSYGVQHFTYEMTPELKQSFRDALLAVGSEDIARAADYLRTKGTAVTVLQPEKSGAETSSAA